MGQKQIRPAAMIRGEDGMTATIVTVEKGRES
jgi:hypothetical protein